MSFNVASVVASPAQGTAFGGIDFTVNLRYSGDRASISDARALVRLRRPSGGQSVVGFAFWQGHSYALEVQAGQDYQIRLLLLLDPATMQVIEEARGNQKLFMDLTIAITGVTTHGGGNPPPWFALREEVERAATIEKSAWVEEFLPSFGLGDYELWELRFPRHPLPDVLESETSLLRKAVHDYNNGEYEDAYQDCRKLVEGLRAKESALGFEGIVGKEEWKRARDYLSIALHSDSEISKKIVRSDAEFAISLVRAITRRIASAVAAPKDKGSR